MDTVIIAKMSIEGGGCTVHGQCVDDTWSFWHTGRAMYLDEHADEAWRQWTSDPVARLSDALPSSWWRMYVRYVHPDFVEQLRTAFYTHQHERGWQERRFDDMRRGA